MPQAPHTMTSKWIDHTAITSLLWHDLAQQLAAIVLSIPCHRPFRRAWYYRLKFRPVILQAYRKLWEVSKFKATWADLADHWCSKHTSTSLYLCSLHGERGTEGYKERRFDDKNRSGHSCPRVFNFAMGGGECVTSKNPGAPWTCCKDPQLWMMSLYTYTVYIYYIHIMVPLYLLCTHSDPRCKRSWTLVFCKSDLRIKNCGLHTKKKPRVLNSTGRTSSSQQQWITTIHCCTSAPCKSNQIMGQCHCPRLPVNCCCAVAFLTLVGAGCVSRGHKKGHLWDTSILLGRHSLNKQLVINLVHHVLHPYVFLAPDHPL